LLPLDGELEFPDGAAVSWKEWMQAGERPHRVLVKRAADVVLLRTAISSRPGRTQVFGLNRWRPILRAAIGQAERHDFCRLLARQAIRSLHQNSSCIRSPVWFRWWHRQP